MESHSETGQPRYAGGAAPHHRGIIMSNPYGIPETQWTAAEQLVQGHSPLARALTIVGAVMAGWPTGELFAFAAEVVEADRDKREHGGPVMAGAIFCELPPSQRISLSEVRICAEMEEG